jgi:hypothetical protein
MYALSEPPQHDVPLVRVAFAAVGPCCCLCWAVLQLRLLLGRLQLPGPACHPVLHAGRAVIVGQSPVVHYAWPPNRGEDTMPKVAALRAQRTVPVTVPRLQGIEAWQRSMPGKCSWGIVMLACGCKYEQCRHRESSQAVVRQLPVSRHGIAAERRTPHHSTHPVTAQHIQHAASHHRHLGNCASQKLTSRPSSQSARFTRSTHHRTAQRFTGLGTTSHGTAHTHQTQH